MLAHSSYRNPKLAKQAHLQKAAYLETLDEDDEWNPSDYAIHLTRRARGLPFWFSLAAPMARMHMPEAMEQHNGLLPKMPLTSDAQPIRNLELLVRAMSFRSWPLHVRVGMDKAEITQRGSDQLLADQSGLLFAPSCPQGEANLLAICNR
jgi:hypothetical protein